MNSASTCHFISFHFSPSSSLTSKTQLVSLLQTIPSRTAQICFLNLSCASLIHDSKTKTKTQRQNSPYSINGKKEISCHWRGTAPLHLSWHMKMMEKHCISWNSSVTVPSMPQTQGHFSIFWKGKMGKEYVNNFIWFEISWLTLLENITVLNWSTTPQTKKAFKALDKQLSQVFLLLLTSLVPLNSSTSIRGFRHYCIITYQKITNAKKKLALLFFGGVSLLILIWKNRQCYKLETTFTASL